MVAAGVVVGLVLSLQGSATHGPVRLDAGGVALHYIEAGKGEPVILLHGGQGDYRAWPAQMAALSLRYRVISYSRRYHYPNANAIVSTNHSADVDAGDLDALISALRPGRVHLIGTSYGAFTALAFALKHPDQVRSLILAEPPILQWANDVPGGADLYRAFMRDAHTMAGRAFAAGRDEDAMRTLIDTFDGAGTFDKLPSERRLAIMQNASFFKALPASTNAFPVVDRDAVRTLPVPTLVIRGERTDPLHRLVTERLAALMPLAKVAVIPNAGHGSPRQNPEAFNRAVVDFLVSLPNR